MQRIGDRHASDAGLGKLSQLGQLGAGASRRCEDDPTLGIDRAGLAEHRATLHQSVDEGVAGREEEVGGSAVFDLVSEIAGRAEHQDHVDVERPLERGRDLFQREREVGGGIDGQPHARRSGRRAGDDDERGQDDSQQNPTPRHPSVLHGQVTTI